MVKYPNYKIAILLLIVAVYVMLGLGFKYGAETGLFVKTIANNTESLPSTLNFNTNLLAAQSFVDSLLVKENGHINLYYLINENSSFQDYDYTNSEAVSYYLLWNAQMGRKANFDKMLVFMKENMLHPHYGYMMWKLNKQDQALGEGRNIASDADLRAIQALIIAQEKWSDPDYSLLINKLAFGLESVAITEDGLLAPYGGIAGENSVWTAKEIWLSYMDFRAVKYLAEKRGEPWKSLYKKMKNAVLLAQLENGLYNQHLTEQRNYGNGLDDGGYSINSLWIMVRAAESNDPELMKSAGKALNFYKKEWAKDGNTVLFTKYDSNGNALSSHDSPWVYALVARAAIALDDQEFIQEMLEKLQEFQQNEVNSILYGSFPEDLLNNPRVGQFTMQESILTMQSYLQKYGSTSSE